MVVKFMWKEQMVNNAKTFLEKKSKMRWRAPPDIKTYYILYSLGWCGAGTEIDKFDQRNWT